MNLDLLTKFASRKLLAMPVGAGILQYLVSVGVPPDYAAIFACVITVALIAGQAWVDVTAAKQAGAKPDLATVAGAVIGATAEVQAGKIPTAEEIVQAIKNAGLMSPVIPPPKPEKPS